MGDSDERGGSKRMKKTASGHNAGMQSGKDFAVKQKELDEEKRQKLKSSAVMGDQEETVYRDKRGKKLDMLNEFMMQQTLGDSKKKKLEEAQFEWGQGAAQKKEREAKAKELQEMASAPFARTADDPQLEKARKSVMRDGDPMARYFEKKREKEECNREVEEDREETNHQIAGSTRIKKKHPVYSGPMPAPNRFGIKPGYRWDAVDRGNKFEHKMLIFISDKASLKEDEYKWSVSDL